MKILRLTILACAMAVTVACESPADPADKLPAPTALQGGYYPRAGTINLWWESGVPQENLEYRIEKKKDAAWELYHTSRAESGRNWTDAYPGPYGTMQEYRVRLCNGTSCSAPSNSVSVAIPIR